MSNEHPDSAQSQGNDECIEEYPPEIRKLDGCRNLTILQILIKLIVILMETDAI